MTITGKTTLILGLTVLAALGAGVRPGLADTVTMFDYPSQYNTRGLSINDSGNVVGVYNTSTGAARGYERMANGTFSAPIIAPNDNQRLHPRRGHQQCRRHCRRLSGERPEL